MKEIEPKRENETPKQFKARLRQDTRMTLYEELHKLTSSSKRRKEKMIERKKKKKMGKNVAPSGSQDVSNIITYSPIQLSLELLLLLNQCTAIHIIIHDL